MTLTVEDGTAKSDADAYCSQAFADAWHTARGITLWSTLSSNEKDQAINRACAYMVQAYRLRWKGYRRTTSQSLDWPRYAVPRPDSYDTGGFGYGNVSYYASDVVPIEVQQANAELALKAAAGDLNADVSRLTKREKVDVIEVEYFEGASPSVRYRSVDQILGPLLKDEGGATISVERA